MHPEEEVAPEAAETRVGDPTEPKAREQGLRCREVPDERRACARATNMEGPWRQLSRAREDVRSGS
jgi:hypothetical protein